MPLSGSSHPSQPPQPPAYADHWKLVGPSDAGLQPSQHLESYSSEIGNPSRFNQAVNRSNGSSRSLGRPYRAIHSPRHCERSEAIQSRVRVSGLLRRFAPRNDERAIRLAIARWLMDPGSAPGSGETTNGAPPLAAAAQVPLCATLRRISPGTCYAGPGLGPRGPAAACLRRKPCLTS